MLVKSGAAKSIKIRRLNVEKESGETCGCKIEESKYEQNIGDVGASAPDFAGDTGGVSAVAIGVEHFAEIATESLVTMSHAQMIDKTDDGAAKSGKGVNWATIAVSVKPHACRVEGSYSDTTLGEPHPKVVSTISEPSITLRAHSALDGDAGIQCSTRASNF
ncbi:hypothetical protein HAX54_039996 [Datura stramonium]|uniref:Uncharacterized protein n=1 Tax=Datura stramonium TaxID=4076 RepID=A0ABS8RQA8_DATST|nr:hypothetical protein [Datura stramonium]